MVGLGSELMIYGNMELTIPLVSNSSWQLAPIFSYCH